MTITTPVSFGYGSQTGYEFIAVERGRIDAFAASDIFAGMPVTLLSASAIGSNSTLSNSRLVRMCASENDQPIGFVRDNAAAGQAVTIWDIGNVVRVITQGSVNAGMEFGVTGASPAVHPISQVTNYYPILGQVTPASFSNVAGSPNSYGAVWSIGQTWEAGNPGNGVDIRVNPRLLSGLY